MMIDVQEAEDRLEELIDAARRGEEVIVSVGGVPMVLIEPLETTASDPAVASSS